MGREDISEEAAREAWDEMLLSMLAMAKFVAEEAIFISRGMTPIEKMVYFALRERQEWESISVYHQQDIGKYVADFLVIKDGEHPGTIIECDGHDFHERTKEQAQHDKERDRNLQSLGYKVYRFTGSEIFKSRGRCVLVALGIEEAKRG